MTFSELDFPSPDSSLLNLLFLLDVTRQQPGGANNFVSNFLSDVIAVVKSHAMGIGGNAVVNFFLSECLLTTHSHKNQVILRLCFVMAAKF